MKSYALFSIYNVTAPVDDKDGVPLIWLHRHLDGGWAQETLVQAGLATVNYAGFEDYQFTVPGKAGDYRFDWKECLKKAEADFRAGKEPHVLFRWPQPK